MRLNLVGGIVAAPRIECRRRSRTASSPRARGWTSCVRRRGARSCAEIRRCRAAAAPDRPGFHLAQAVDVALQWSWPQGIGVPDRLHPDTTARSHRWRLPRQAAEPRRACPQPADRLCRDRRDHDRLHSAAATTCGAASSGRASGRFGLMSTAGFGACDRRRSVSLCPEIDDSGKQYGGDRRAQPECGRP